jgi:hypothetical protein
LFLHSRTLLTGQFLPGMGGKLAPFNLIFHNETDWVILPFITRLVE